MYRKLKYYLYICAMDWMTETDIVNNTGMEQSTVHRILKKNLSEMLFKQITKRVRLYHTGTLPKKIKENLKNDTDK